MTAEEIYESVTNGGSSDLAEAAAILNRTGRWCLIGGLAVNCYVEPVYTVDAHIVVASKNLSRVRENPTAAGFRFEEFAHSLNASKPGSKLQIQFTQDARYQGFIGYAEHRESSRQLHPRGEVGRYYAREDLGVERSRTAADETKERRTRSHANCRSISEIAP